MRFKPPRVGEILAGAFGLLLLLSLFLPWYRASTGCPREPCPAMETTAFEAFAAVDIYLLIVALAGVGLLLAETTQRAPAMPVAWAALAAPLALVAFCLALWRTLDPPGGADEALFALLGLLAAGGLTVACFVSMRAEGVDQRRAREAYAATGAPPDPLPVPSRPSRESPAEG